MVFGAHLIVHSKDADADRSFLMETFGFASVDAGAGWLIFALPPAELAALAQLIVDGFLALFIRRHTSIQSSLHGFPF